MTVSTKIRDLNRAMPATAKAQLGTLLELLIDTVNVLSGAYLKNAFIVTAPTLVKKAVSSPTVKSSTAVRVLAGGNFQAKSADTDMSAIAGTLATAKSALWAFYIDSAGTITTSTKTADAATAAAALVLQPAIPDNKIELGYIIVSNASGANFVGGTTALDATNVTTTYVSNPVTAALPGAIASLEA